MSSTWGRHEHYHGVALVMSAHTREAWVETAPPCDRIFA